jgi:hypothetical protein
MRIDLPRLFCRIAGHRRSGRRAFIDPVERRWHSYCKRCGTRLRRDAVNGWQEAEAEPGA